MSAAYYDETEALERYFVRIEFFMTEFEARSWKLAMKRDLAEHSDAARERLPKWLAEESEEVRQASLVGPVSVRRQIVERIQQELRDGSLLLNRCPKCERLARTPLARQCLWCGYDWHGGR